jgi:hypothetical protein
VDCDGARAPLWTAVRSTNRSTDPAAPPGARRPSPAVFVGPAIPCLYGVPGADGMPSVPRCAVWFDPLGVSSGGSCCCQRCCRLGSRTG